GGFGFGNSSFGNSNFGNSGFGGLGFSSSLIGSGVSIIPNLLFGSLLNAGTSVFGGAWGILGANALSFATRAIGSELFSNGFGQGGFGGGSGFDQGGVGGGTGFYQAPVWPACGPVANFGRPGWVSAAYCGP